VVICAKKDANSSVTFESSIGDSRKEDVKSRILTIPWSALDPAFLERGLTTEGSLPLYILLLVVIPP
jgi:hypothetical protein